MIKAAGDDNSAFVSCRGEAGERLSWAHLTPGPEGDLVTISTVAGARVHTETRPGALDLVFRSIQQGDEGKRDNRESIYELTNDTLKVNTSAAMQVTQTQMSNLTW